MALVPYRVTFLTISPLFSTGLYNYLFQKTLLSPKYLFTVYVLALVSFLYRNIGFNTFLGYTIFFFTHRTTSFKELFVHFLHRTIRFKDGLTAENFNKNTQLD